MRNHKLFHHPVGVFSFGARWYLAALAILVLVLVAVHFVIHIQAQERARLLMHHWLGKAQVEAGEIRYHLLRNAMTLHDVRIQRAGDSLTIARILVRADARSLTSDAPRIGEVKLAGVQANIHDLRAMHWRKDPALLRIWRAVESLSFDDGQLILYPAAEQAGRLIFEKVSMVKKRRDGRLDVRARLAAGTVQGTLFFSDGPKQWLSGGKAEWQGVEADAVLQAFGWQSIGGLLDGEVNFRMSETASGSVARRDLHFQGRLNLTGETNTGKSALYMQGERKTGKWEFEVQAKAWPLTPWAALLPSMQGMRLQEGLWQGMMHVAEGSRGWRGESDSGSLQDIQWSIGSDNAGPGRAHRLDYKKFSWDTSRREIRVHDVSLQRPAWNLAEEMFSSISGLDGWRLRIDQFDVHDGKIALELQRGNVVLAPLQGQGDIDSQGRLNLDLASPDSSGATGGGHWTMHVAMDMHGNQDRSGQWQLAGRDMPLLQLRPLLPITGSAGKPLSLEGMVDLDVNAALGKGRWQATGAMQIDDLNLKHDGNELRARKAAIEFGPVGPGLIHQTIHSFKLHDWLYIAPLKPLTNAPAAMVSISDVETRNTSPLWWATLLHDNNWRIHGLDLLSGSISVGREDSYWARNLSLHSEDLRPDGLSRVIVRGNIDGGSLTVDGKWSPLSAQPAYLLQAKLAHANPFFLNDWLQASGMPRLLRGRLSYALNMTHGKLPGTHVAEHRLHLDRGLVEDSVSPDDPLLDRLGYGLADAIARLDNGKGRASLAFKVTGDTAADALALNRTGKAMQQAWQAGMTKEALLTARHENLHDEARIRLHETSGLSHNERARLRKLWRHLKAKRKSFVDLEPVWTGATLDATLIGRIRYTQSLIESFMHSRGISSGRIYPVWPTRQNHAEELGFIHVLMRSSGRK